MKSIRDIGFDGLERHFSKPGFRANESIDKDSIDVIVERETNANLLETARLFVLRGQGAKQATKMLYWAWGQEMGLHLLSFSSKYVIQDELAALFFGKDVTHIVRSEYDCSLAGWSFVSMSVTHTIYALSDAQRQAHRSHL
jgi:hypothetical protein